MSAHSLSNDLANLSARILNRCDPQEKRHASFNVIRIFNQIRAATT